MSTEAEHYGQTDNVKELLFERNLVTEIFDKEPTAKMIYVEPDIHREPAV